MGKTLLEFSFAPIALMGQVKQCAPEGPLNVEVLLRDQFVEHVLDSALCRKLKQLVHSQPAATLLDVYGKGMRWEREVFTGGALERSCSYVWSAVWDAAQFSASSSSLFM